MNRKRVHEAYHSGIRIQKRVIDVNNFTYRDTLRYVHRYFDDYKSVLDIGCGTGTVDFFIAQSGKNVLGVDISKRAILAAQENSRIFGLEKQTMFQILDFPSKTVRGKFDGVLISEVLEHLDNDVIAVINIKKLCKKGGIVIASSPSKNAPLYRLGLLHDFDKRVGHLRRYSFDEFSSLFKKNGFKIIEFSKTEGVLRNFLFTNDIAGKTIRYIRGPISGLVTIIDNFLIPIFGESNYYIIAQKK